MSKKRDSLVGELAAQMLAMGRSNAEVASEVDVSERTITNWLADPAFADRVAAYRDEMARAVRARTLGIELAKLEGRTRAAQIRHDRFMAVIEERQKLHSGSADARLRSGLYLLGDEGEVVLDSELIGQLRTDEVQVHRQTMDAEGGGAGRASFTFVVD